MPCRRPRSTGSCSRSSSATPAPTEEFVIVERRPAPCRRSQTVLSASELLELQRQVDQVFVDPALIEYAVRLVTATRAPEAHRHPGDRSLHHLRREPARVDQPDPHRAGARLRARPRLRPAPGRPGHVARRAPPPAGALVRGADRRRDERRPAQDDHRPHPRARWCRCVATATSASAPERVLRRLEWQVIRRLDGLLQGDYRSLFFGYGVDFANLREYQARTTSATSTGTSRPAWTRRTSASTRRIGRSAAGSCWT